MKNRKNVAARARMAWTEVFDDEANRFGKSFTKEEITAALLNNPDWRKDSRKRIYVKSCIKDRIKRGRIAQCEDGSFRWLGYKS